MKPEMLREDLDYDFEGLEDLEFDDEDNDDDDFYDDMFDDDDDDDDDDVEAFLDDEDDDGVERHRGRRRRRRRRSRSRRRAKTARGRGYFRRQLRGGVKKTELRSSLSRVASDIRKNAKAIRTNAGRIGSNQSRISSVARLNGRQSKDIAKIRADQAQQQQMQLLMTLLDGGDREFKEVKVVSGRLEDGNAVIEAKEERDSFSLLLPLLLGGMGGSSGQGGALGMNNPAMMLMLAEAFKK